jgi:LPS sulfotransferase NodH
MAIFFPHFPKNHHVKKASQHFGSLEGAAVPVPAGTKFVLICYTNRCGSNYLADIIASSGVFNIAGEDLNYENIVQGAKKFGSKSFQAYFAALVERRRKAGHYFLKVAPAHLELLGKSGVLAQILSDTKFVLIERADKLGQAISFAIATQTQKWTSLQPANISEAEASFTPTVIDDAIVSFSEAHMMFYQFFGRNGIVPANVFYEHLVEDPDQCLQAIGKSIGLAGLRHVPGRVRLERQAGPVSEEWRAKYLAMSADGQPEGNVLATPLAARRSA